MQHLGTQFLNPDWHWLKWHKLDFGKKKQPQIQVDGTEGSTFTFMASNRCAAILIPYRNVSAIAVSNSNLKNTSGSNPTMDVSLAGVPTGARIVCGYAWDRLGQTSSETWTDRSGFTRLWNVSAGYLCGLIVDLDGGTDGTYNASLTQSGVNGGWVSLAVALTPA